MTPHAELILDAKNGVGESPVWRADEQALYWVDIPACQLWRWDARSLAVNILLFLLGTFLDMAATILICTPIFLPICAQFGMDPAQFGVMMLINCALGLNTPPVGATQFAGCAIGGISISEVMRSIWPFYGALTVALMLVTYVPAFSLWLPGVLLTK